MKYQHEVTPSKDKSFKEFDRIEWGYRAMFMLLYTYQKKNGLDTIRKMINRYAPATENHTDVYVQTVSQRSGVPADGRITTTNRDIMIPIVAAMSFVENGTPAVMTDVEKGWNLFMSTR